jgi:L-seryl-tRNA(Ser) seleniumtransferase
VSVNALRAIPSMDQLLRLPQAEQLCLEHGREPVVAVLREVLAQLRDSLKNSGPPRDAATLLEQCRQQLQPRLRRVINATGVVLHTNMGRAPLSALALERIQEVAAGYSNLEFDLQTGQRGSRHSHLKPLLRRRTGAEDALLVNNCAAAMVLILDEFARGREVIVSRGELVEIGGSFRLPDVLARSGAKLIEVGTTNRTYLRDFEGAITENTGLLLSTHLSNFALVGFTHKATDRELVELGQRSGVPTCLDLGSGLLDPIEGLNEPDVKASVAAGYDLVAFSGDKLLGGPQLGIILGKTQWIARLAKNPLMRALRPDKLSLAALEGTLMSEPPVIAMLKDPNLKARAEALAQLLEGEVIAGSSSVGGGSAPGEDLPTWLVRVNRPELAAPLRLGDPPIIVRQNQGALLLDPRTLKDSDFETIAHAFRRAKDSL